MALKTNSCTIDMRHNEITGLPFFGIQRTCTHNRCKPLTLVLEDNPLSCDCEGFDLIRYFQKEWPSNVRQMVRINDNLKCTYAKTGEKTLIHRVDINRISCSLNTCSNCPSNCSCLLHKHTRTVYINCSRKWLDVFPKDLPITRDETSQFWFSHNRIRSIDGIMYPYTIHVLALSHNNIGELPQNFHHFSKLKVRILSGKNVL